MMTDASYNPNDPAFLISRSLDESLTEDESQTLRSAVQSPEELDQMAAILRGVDSLVKEWGARRIEVDETAFVDGVLGRIANEHSDDYGEVDEALRTWRMRAVGLPEDAFIAGVSRRLHESSARTTGASWVYRIRRPLAAAAALGLVVTATLLFQASQRPIAEVSIVKTYTSLTADAPLEPRESRVVVFDRTVVADSNVSRDLGRTAFMVIGADSEEEEFVDAPPL